MTEPLEIFSKWILRLLFLIINHIVHFHAFLVQAVDVIVFIFCTFQPSTKFLYYFASLSPSLCLILPAGTLPLFSFASLAPSLCLAPRVERPLASFPPFLGVRACVLLSQGVINLWVAPCRTLLYDVRVAALYSTVYSAHGSAWQPFSRHFECVREYNRRVVWRPATCSQESSSLEGV